MKAKQSAVFAAACSLALSLFLVPEAGISRGQLRRYAPELCSAGKTAREEYELLPGTELQQTVTALHGEKPGETVYIVAGLHGDEQAAWEAGNLLKEMHISAGTVWILSPANAYGALHGQRTTRSGRDANRWFGSETNWDAAVLDNAIAQELAEKQPDLILDLHEAHENALDDRGYYDSLGNSIVCYSLENTGDMVLEFLHETQLDPRFTTPFTLFSSPPAGSLNEYSGRVLGLDAITVETWRGEALSARIQAQLAAVSCLLQQNGMF